MAKYKAELYLQNPNGEEFYACSRCGRAFSSKMVQAQPINENGTALYCPHCKTELAGLDHLLPQKEQEQPPEPELHVSIRVYLKSGGTLPDILCKECEVTVNETTSKLERLKITGMEFPKSCYIDVNEVAAVVRVD